MHCAYKCIICLGGGAKAMLRSALKPEKNGSVNLRGAKLDEWPSTDLLFESTINVWPFNSLVLDDFSLHNHVGI